MNARSVTSCIGASARTGASPRSSFRNSAGAFTKPDGRLLRRSRHSRDIPAAEVGEPATIPSPSSASFPCGRRARSVLFFLQRGFESRLVFRDELLVAVRIEEDSRAFLPQALELALQPKVTAMRAEE